MSTRVVIRHATERVRTPIGYGLVLLVVLAIAIFSPVSAAAHGTESERLPHSLSLEIAFPDDGLAESDQLCVALFAGVSSDLTAPSQSLCLKAGESTLLFEELTHGPYTVLLPAPGSVIADDRYQGQIIDTDIPDSPSQAAFGISATLKLTPQAAGTTGSVEVTIYGCPPGTDEGGDADSWQDKCSVVASDVPVSLSGIGSIEDTTAQAITGEEAEPGRARFTNLPAGAYEIEEILPVNVEEEPAVFVESSIDGSVTSLEPDDTLALRPAEIKSVNLYVVLEPDSEGDAPNADTPLDDATTGNPSVSDAPISPPGAGLGDTEVTSGVTSEADAAPPAEPSATAPVADAATEEPPAPVASPVAEETP